jgi:hypothetical protein
MSYGGSSTAFVPFRKHHFSMCVSVYHFFPRFYPPPSQGTWLGFLGFSLPHGRVGTSMRHPEIISCVQILKNLPRSSTRDQEEGHFEIDALDRNRVQAGSFELFLVEFRGAEGAEEKQEGNHGIG